MPPQPSGSAELVAATTLRPDRPVEPAAATSPTRAVWNEVAWPFPIDQWGKGKAFRCHAADCGTEVSVYIRPKIGFCNCSTGVADDEELDRISDFDLFNNTLSPLGAGREISVAWMKGRSRPYSIAGAQRGRPFRAVDRLQRSVRCYRRDRSRRPRSADGGRAGGDRISQQPHHHPLG